MPICLIAEYRADLASITNAHDRDAARRYWLRAVIETLRERELTDQPVPSRRPKPDEVIRVRYLGFWRKRSTLELRAFLDHVQSFWNRRENRSTPL